MKKTTLNLFLHTLIIFNISNAQVTFQENIITDVSHSVNAGRFVFAADLDNDGDMDVLSASNLDDKIAWYENDGNGNFGSQQILLFVPSSSTLGVADLDNDNDLDIIYASFIGNSIGWLKNDGSGNFNSGDTAIALDANNATNVQLADIDNDGDMDVVTILDVENKIAWYENINNAIDIDNDGDIDVVTASKFDDKIVWSENDGSGNFGPIQNINTNANGAESVFAADLDSDGDIDIVSASKFDNTIGWYENTNGQGNFSDIQVISTNAISAESVYGDDLDNDGDIDIISASYDDDKIAWYENTDGQGSFSSEIIVSTNADGAQFVTTADINGDGAIDIISTSNLNARFAWHKNLFLSINELNGTIKLDIDSDGCDVQDNGMANMLVTSYTATDTFSTFTSNNGTYQFFLEEESYTTELESIPNYYTSSPISQITNFVGTSNLETKDFCIESITSTNDLNVSLYPNLDDPRPGFNTTYQIIYKNNGTTQSNGTVTFDFDDTMLQFLNASESISSQTSNTLTFNFSNLNPFKIRTIDIEFNVFATPIVNIDDIISNTVTISPVTGDETEEDNIYNLEQIVIGSYDPNDIRVLEGEEVLFEDADKYLHYIIRF